jgi:hypothetical protein
MYMSVYATGQNKLSRCVKLQASIKYTSNLDDGAIGDSNISTANRASSSHDLPVTNDYVQFSHIIALLRRLAQSQRSLPGNAGDAGQRQT